jgi:hypothetical protein
VAGVSDVDGSDVLVTWDVAGRAGADRRGLLADFGVGAELLADRERDRFAGPDGAAEVIAVSAASSASV